MSDYIDKYKRRLNRNGADLGEAYSNNTIAFIESTFSASPTFRRIGVRSIENPEITEMDARVVEVERLGTLREVLFRPTSDGLNVGTYITFDKHTWLIFDRFSKDKVTVEQCNRKLKWKDRDGNLISLDCIASSQDLGSKAKQSKNEIEFNKYDVSLPLGQLFVFVELSDLTKQIRLNQRFIFGSNAYEVTGIDDTTMVREYGTESYGILQLTVKITTIKEEDDFVNRIAYNKYEDISTTTPVEGNPDTGEGGMIW
ncbi:hypothetical protein JDW21_19650 [Bacillus subtilis]|uniref:Structural protein n=1 Tax=Bacillus phage vB_BsuS_PJN02 TaxID=2920374 RepID=A0AC61TRR6_9CAUD|nr:MULTISPECIES: hypothetical protein [Bacillus subtilis group]YP_010681662.1 putative structural protein [Bacillus phage vB_BsuS_PJN02]UUG68069.1 hypothetical protein [Bacillus phage PK-3]MCR4361972.1 hypothetical protein [Bacillus subtilis]UNH58387.1 putative structural protein [Bacillus phage vB_BsuS_PJN02]UQB84211.1 hypothetical protein KMZ31_20015 [Bacillus amyloliquefaciens]WOF32834.1 hypothetical protein OEJ84_23270 [Bacillus subtilis]